MYVNECTYTYIYTRSRKCPENNETQGLYFEDDNIDL